MALPQSISGDHEACGPPMKAPNGAIYLAVTDGSDIEVWKLPDPDSDSWSEQNAAGKPTAGAAGAIDYMHACQYEHLIFVGYPVLNGSEHDITETTFNTATDAWEGSTRTVYSGGPGEPPASYYPCALVATPNYLYCLHPSDDEKVHGTAYERCMVSYRDLDGTTWNNSSEIGSGEQDSKQGTGLAINSSEYAVVFESKSSPTAFVWNRSSFGSSVNASIVCDVCIQAVSYMDGSTNRIIAAYKHGTTATVVVWRLTSSGTSMTSVGTTSVGSQATNFIHRPGLCRWGTTLYCWLSNTSYNPAYSDSADHGASWSGPTQFSDPSNNVTEHPWANAYTRNGSLKLGIVYKEGTTQLSYDERTISNPSAPGFASARTPVRQNKIVVSA